MPQGEHFKGQMDQFQIIIELSVRESYHKNLVHATLGVGDLYFIYIFVISKGFLKLLTIKINGKIRRFDRASVIIK